MKAEYNLGEIENKWQKVWREKKLFSPDINSAKNPFYNLMMFPYPSAEGLHVGNMYAFCGSDIYGRFKRMQGNSVFEPIGLDGFGIHSENYAIKVGRHPKDQAKISQKNFYRQLQATGNAYDWERSLETYDADYYKWTQWIFIKLFKAGLAYRKKSAVNFCPADKTVLADEQVIDGKCERCQTQVVKKDLEQWFFKITKYADRLLDNLDKLDWSERVKVAQRNWIGKKEGIEISYKVVGKSKTITCWTSRPDTNFGATFFVLSPEHSAVMDLTTREKKTEIEKYIKLSQSKTNEDRIAQGREKTGVFTGSYAVNNLNGERLPIWVSDFVLMEFGTGVVVGVPGHDRRDFEFAKKFKLPIRRVVVGKDGDKSEIERIEQVQEEQGTMINSDFLDGLSIHEATKKIMDYLESKGWGRRKTTYHLRDWLISRQRYWGAPIPIIYCDKCGTVPVSEKDLPVLLPDVSDWRPKGEGKSPLANIAEFVNAKCPNCGGDAKREADVSDTFLDSAWYFLRYTSVDKKHVAWDDKRVSDWLPVDMYIGGAEHSVLHLLYSRFLTMVFADLGLVDFEEPFKKFRAHGLLISKGAKMSKSRGNIVNPDDYIAKYGADALRLYLMFCGRFEQGGDFQDKSIEGISRFLKRVWKLAGDWSEYSEDSVNQKVRILRRLSQSESQRVRVSDESDNLKHRFTETPIHRNTEYSEYLMHKTIKKVGEDIENLSYNTAIAALMEWLNFLERKLVLSTAAFGEPRLWRENLELSSKKKNLITHHSALSTEEEMKTFLLLLAPFAPHISEELWQRIKVEKKVRFESIHLSPWPKYDQKLARSTTIELVIQVNGRLRDKVSVNAGISQDEAKKLALASPKIKKYLSNNKYKTIFVADRLMNFVLGS